MFYLTHSTHLWIYGIQYMVKDHSDSDRGYSFWIAARDLLYAPSHRQDGTYYLCYTTCRALAEIRNSPLDPPWGINPTSHHTTNWMLCHGVSRDQKKKSKSQSNLLLKIYFIILIIASSHKSQNILWKSEGNKLMNKFLKCIRWDYIKFYFVNIMWNLTEIIGSLYRGSWDRFVNGGGGGGGSITDLYVGEREGL